jgi:hypothetical protein
MQHRATAPGAADFMPIGHAQADVPPPVFIAGCGRSGTTYLKTLVDAHPDVFVPTESLFIVDYLAYGRCLPRPLLYRLFFSEPQLRVWYRGPAFDATSLAELVASAHQRAAAGAGARVWGQKTPRFIRHMTLLDKAFPAARWILVHRDPRAVVSSMLRSTRHTYSVRLACRRWNRDNAALIAGRGGREGRILVVSFESLVTQPALVLERIWHFLAVPPIPLQSILERAQVQRMIGSTFEQNAVREGVRNDPTKAETWRRHLRPSQQAYIAAECRDLMERLGYAADTAVGSVPELRGDTLQAARDIGIAWEYLWHWPAYLLHTALRRAAMVVACSLRRPASDT